MKFLFIHQNLPSQFLNLMTALADSGHEIYAIRHQEKNHTPFNSYDILERVNTIRYNLPKINYNELPGQLINLNKQYINGTIISCICEELKKIKFYPDVIFVHSGWGENLFLKNEFPKSHLISYIEIFYDHNFVPINFDLEYPDVPNVKNMLTFNRANCLQACFDADEILTPTIYQSNQIPKLFHDKLITLHDGVLTDKFKPNSNARFTLPSGKVLTNKDLVITYVARGLEPSRGFHIFMRAIPKLLEWHPDANIVIIGNDKVYYGAPCEHDMCFRESALMKLGTLFDSDHATILSEVPQIDLIQLLQISTVHVYLTYPFFLSISPLEAMSIGCNMVCSNTGPVHEFVTDNVTGLYFDFFNVDELVKKVNKVINTPKELRTGIAGRQSIVDTIDFKTKIWPIWIQKLNLT